MASKRIAHIAGTSTTSVERGLLIESSKVEGSALVTVTGVDSKRHASILMDASAIASAIDALHVAASMIGA